MSDLHSRSTSSSLADRFHRKISVLSGVFRPLVERACRALSDRIVAMRRMFRQQTSHIRRR